VVRSKFGIILYISSLRFIQMFCNFSIEIKDVAVLQIIEDVTALLAITD
jgi:hypothetical protein